MANELGIRTERGRDSITFRVRSQNTLRWYNPATGTLEDFDAASEYGIPATEDAGSDDGQESDYFADFPALAAGTYLVTAYDGQSAISDPTQFLWSGGGEVVNPPPAPDSPAQSVGILMVTDGQGNPAAGRPVEFRMIETPEGTGLATDGRWFTIRSGSDGVLPYERAQFLRGARYSGRRDGGQEHTFTVPDSDNFALPNILGRV